MLDAYLTESDYFPELLRYCNLIYELLPLILKGVYDFQKSHVTNCLTIWISISTR